MALAGIDVACWDALSRSAGLPLATMLGAGPKRIPAYNSNGLGLGLPDEVADEAEELLEGGFRAVKLRLGRQTLAADLAAVRAVRRRLPDDVALMADFNQALGLAEAEVLNEPRPTASFHDIVDGLSGANKVSSPADDPGSGRGSRAVLAMARVPPGVASRGALYPRGARPSFMTSARAA